MSEDNKTKIINLLRALNDVLSPPERLGPGATQRLEMDAPDKEFEDGIYFMGAVGFSFVEGGEVHAMSSRSFYYGPDASAQSLIGFINETLAAVISDVVHMAIQQGGPIPIPGITLEVPKPRAQA